MDRLDMLHKVVQVIRIDDSKYGTLHRLPLPAGPRILDLGCGTGIWAIDIAEYVIQKINHQKQTIEREKNMFLEI